MSRQPLWEIDGEGIAWSVETGGPAVSTERVGVKDNHKGVCFCFNPVNSEAL